MPTWRRRRQATTCRAPMSTWTRYSMWGPVQACWGRKTRRLSSRRGHKRTRRLQASSTPRTSRAGSRPAPPQASSASRTSRALLLPSGSRPAPTQGPLGPSLPPYGSRPVSPQGPLGPSFPPSGSRPAPTQGPLGPSFPPSVSRPAPLQGSSARLPPPMVLPLERATSSSTDKAKLVNVVSQPNRKHLLAVSLLYRQHRPDEVS